MCGPNTVPRGSLNEPSSMVLRKPTFSQTWGAIERPAVRSGQKHGGRVHIPLQHTHQDSRPTPKRGSFPLQCPLPCGGSSHGHQGHNCYDEEMHVILFDTDRHTWQSWGLLLTQCSRVTLGQSHQSLTLFAMYVNVLMRTLTDGRLHPILQAQLARCWHQEGTPVHLKMVPAECARTGFTLNRLLLTWGWMGSSHLDSN